MWSFKKKKKIYKVETETLYSHHPITVVVKAYDEADAWRQADKQTVTALGRCFSIEELKDA